MLFAKPRFLKSTQVTDLPIADHRPTLLQLQLNVMSLSPQHKGPCISWNFKLTDFLGLNNFLKSVDWSPVYTTPDASAALTLWENILVSSMEQFIPFRTYGAPRPHSKPWFNSFLNRLRRKRNRLFSRSKLLDRTQSAAYRKVRNHYVAQLRSAERQYYAKQVSALQSARLVNDPQRWWKTAKAACGLNSVDSIPPLLHNDCMKVTTKEKAACLNSVFAKQCNAQSPTSRSCSLSTNTTAGNFSFSRIEYPSVTKNYRHSTRRRSGQSVTASDFGSNGPRFESGRGRCVESLDKALYSHCPKEKPSY